jgi:hypothetical protein
MATKKELIQKIKDEVKFYAQPRGIGSRGETMKNIYCLVRVIDSWRRLEWIRIWN